MKRQLKNMIVVAVAGCLALLSGCSQRHDYVPFENAEIGILYSTDNQNISKIEWFDEGLRSLGTEEYPFAGASVSQSNAHLNNGCVYLAPTGLENKKDYGKIAVIDPIQGRFQEIDTGRVNQYDCDVEGDYAVLTSNLNGTCSIDLIHLATKEMKTITQSDNGLICTQPILINGKVNAVALNDQQYYICSCNFEYDTTEIIAELPNETTTYLERHGSDLVYLSNGTLVKYHTQTGESDYVSLSRTNALNLNIAGDVAWIAYTDPFNEDSESVIEARDYDSGKIMGRVFVKGAVLQMETDNQRLLVRINDSVVIYTFDGKELTETNRISCKKDGLYFGGFFYLSGR